MLIHTPNAAAEDSGLASPLTARPRFSPDVIEATSFADAWKALLRPDTTGVILHRDPAPFTQALADLRECNLREWGRNQAERFVGSDPDMLRSHIRTELLRIGVAEHMASTIELLTADMVRINRLVQAMTGEDDLRSHVGSMWRDKRGFHIDSGDNIGAFVSYIGPGCLVVGKDQVEYNSHDPAQQRDPARLALKPGVVPYLTDTFDIVFLKGRADLTKTSLVDNVGLPHSSPNPYDPERGYKQRLSFIAYGTRVGEYFAQAPDLSRIPVVPGLDT